MKLKLNVRLLRKIQKHILAESLRLDMMEFVQSKEAGDEIVEEVFPPCGITGCIAGWGLMLDGMSALRASMFTTLETVERASKLLGLEYNSPDDSFWAHWAENSIKPNGEAIRLFLVEKWPKKFREPFLALEKQLVDAASPEEGKKLRTKQAKITSRRIDFFIATKKTDVK